MTACTNWLWEWFILFFFCLQSQARYCVATPSWTSSARSRSCPPRESFIWRTRLWPSRFTRWILKVVHCSPVWHRLCASSRSPSLSTSSYLPAHNEITPLVTLQGAGAAVHLLRLLRVMSELAPDRVSFPQAAAARWLFVLFDWFHLGQTHLV